LAPPPPPPPPPVLRSFQITVSAEGEISGSLSGVDPLEGTADSGNLADDLTDEVLGSRSTSVAPTRARLIEKGLLWTPEHGYAAFTVPQFDRFMKRTYELNSSR
jgi:hypothetical protein